MDISQVRGGSKPQVTSHVAIEISQGKISPESRVPQRLRFRDGVCARKCGCMALGQESALCVHSGI